MEFWGVDVKSGETLMVSPGDGMIIHLSQASVGEIKKEKGGETVCLFVNIDGKKLVLGTLFTDKLPQQQFDLVFDKDFEISHNWKSGSIYFYGYKAANNFEDEDELPGDSDEFDSEEDIPNAIAINGNSDQIFSKEKPAEAAKVNTAKHSKVVKQKVKIVEPPKDIKLKEGDSSSSDDLISEDDEDSEDENEDDDSDDESDESEEAAPKKIETSKKRPADSASKTPIPDKKAKSDGQKGGRVATPYPVKQVGMASANKPNQQTPKSGGTHTCKPCNRTFGSEKALESHSKAKHGN